jgi:hypothetical protein
LLAALGVALAAAGCSGGRPEFTISPDEMGISDLVDALNDSADKPAKAAVLFVKGSAPDANQLKLYKDYTYNLTNRPDVGGTEVTAPIRVTTIKDKVQKSTTRDWTFEKEGAGWKIKSAPLP